MLVFDILFDNTYDNFHRLQNVVDKNGHLLNENEYKYQN